MPIENKYTESAIVAGKLPSAFKSGGGGDTFTLAGVVAVAVADDDGSVYRVFKSVPANFVPINMTVQNTAITGGTAYEFGLYRENLGAVVDADALAATITMATARTVATSNNVGLTTLTLGELKTLAVLSASSNPDEAYDICLTATTVGSAAGTIAVIATFVAA